MYSDELLLIVNGVTYPVKAYTRTSIENVPAGSVRLEIAGNGFGLLRSETVNLPAGGTHRLEASIRP